MKNTKLKSRIAACSREQAAGEIQAVKHAKMDVTTARVEARVSDFLQRAAWNEPPSSSPSARGTR